MKNQLEIVPVRWIDRVLEIALESAPQPLAEDEVAKPAEPAAAATSQPAVPPAGDILTH